MLGITRCPERLTTHCAQLSNELLTHYYRVVNNKDIVARLPRAKLTGRLGCISHSCISVHVLLNEGCDPSLVDLLNAFDKCRAVG